MTTSNYSVFGLQGEKRGSGQRPVNWLLIAALVINLAVWATILTTAV